MGSRLESNSSAVRKRIENHTFENEDGEEYEGSSFGGFSDYFRRKKIKLQNLDAEIRAHSANSPPIFRGIVVHVNGYTQPSLNELHHLIVSHGGGFMQYLDGKTTVTHVVASSLTPKKVVEFRRYRIVKPAWIVESVNVGHLLPWDTFRLVDEGVSQKVLQFDNGKMSSGLNDKATSYRDQTDSSWYTSRLVKDNDSIKQTSRKTSPRPGELDQSCPLSRSSTRAFQDEGFRGDQNDLEQKLRATDKAKRQESLISNTELFPNDTIEIADSNPINRQINEDNLDGSFLAPKSPVSATNVDSEESNRIVVDVSTTEDVQVTAEEHNTALLSDPYVRKSSTLNPEFLEQYYRESRLHHLSTWKADLKAQLRALTAERTASQKARQKRVPGARRYILHVDFDSFFVAVSLKKFPQYVDKPVVVAHGSGSGSEIASCNYPARKFGVKNGMWMKRALELCSELKTIPYDFPSYEEASKAFYEAAIGTGGIVQSVSIDEALIDVTSFCLKAGGTDGITIREDSIWKEQSKAEEIAQILRDSVKDRTGCSVSIGIGGNVLIAKCALRKAKPAGQYQVKPEEVLEFLAPLKVEALPGVAWSIGAKLKDLGINFVKDIRNCSKEKLASTLGPKTSEKLWNYSRGIDQSEVGEQVIRKSVSAEVNWGVRFETQEQAEDFVDSLCGELNKRLLKEQVKGRQLTMKIMKRAVDAPLDPPKHLGHGKCDTFNKSVVFGVATNSKEVLSKESISILRGYSFSPGELRGLGVQMQKLEPIKGSSGGPFHGNQTRLQFKTGDNGKNVDQETIDPIQDDLRTPEKPKSSLSMPLIHLNSPSQKPLNTLGTQFLLPTQVDSEILAELPQDIRDRLANHVQESSDDEIASIYAESKSSQNELAIPKQSRLDPEILDALPEDLKAEIYEHYRTSPRKFGGQSVLPQSPRKNRSIREPKKLLRSRGRFHGSLLSRLRNSSQTDDPTLTQANFLTTSRLQPQQDSPGRSSEADGQSLATLGLEQHSDVSPEFLTALPEDLRREVLHQQRRDRLQLTSGLDIEPNTSRRRPQRQTETPIIQKFLKLEPRPAKPTFTAQRLSELKDHREAISAWFREFESDGPYQEDIEALVRYLRQVVEEEMDMSKAVKVAKWMEWVVEHGLGAERHESGRLKNGMPKWLDALECVKEGVRAAVRARELGHVDL